MWGDKPLEDYTPSKAALDLAHAYSVYYASTLMFFDLGQIPIGQKELIAELGRVRAAIYAEINHDPDSWVEDWIGVDIDRTLVEFHFGKWDGINHFGAPLPGMVERIRKGLAAGKKFKIFTARICNCGRATHGQQHTVLLIQRWCQQHIGAILPITNMKDCGCREIWDDIARQVIPNTGEFLDEKYQALEAEKASLQEEVKRLRKEAEDLRDEKESLWVRIEGLREKVQMLQASLTGNS